MPTLRAELRQRQDLDAGLGDHDGMLELSGEAAVLRSHSPAVALGKQRLFGPGVDHRLDSEADAGLEFLAAGFRSGIVRDRWRLVILPPDAVANIFFDDTKAAPLGDADDRLADFREATIRAAGVDGCPESVVGTLHHAASQVRRGADDECLG